MTFSIIFNKNFKRNFQRYRRVPVGGKMAIHISGSFGFNQKIEFS
jgi:hypothetical protein